jgi:phosphoribosylaminoimidazole-succinocarboxamide synthase
MSGAAPFVRSGKVRDLYAVGPDRVLLVASDRISAFDVVLPTLIPDKGRVLTGLSRFWFAETEGIVANHLLSSDLEDVDPADLPTSFRRVTAEPEGGAVLVTELAPDHVDLRGRIMVCRRVDILPVEIIVRGYLAGSAWRDYQATGVVSGIRLPDGLRESDRLPEPVFTPSTKAEIGTHDEPIDFDRLVGIVGGALAERLRTAALKLYAAGSAVCERAGIILADTKLEFGVWPDPTDLILADEVLTPDSSRFWEAASYEPGGPQASYDKQYVRDWLERQPWDKTAPGPELPAEIVAGTRSRYIEAFERITGASFERYLEEDLVEP